LFIIIIILYFLFFIIISPRVIASAQALMAGLFPPPGTCEPTANGCSLPQWDLHTMDELRVLS
jgi:hypothetical protein